MKIAMSDILKKGILFPQFISTKRILMMSSILKQCSILGFNGINDEEQLLESIDSANIPKLHGRNVICGIMSWNLFNYEDACIISESLANNLTTYKTTIEIIEHINLPTLHINLGDKIKPHTLLASSIVKNKHILYYSKNNINAIVDKIEKETELINDVIIHRFKLSIISEYKCNIGSKVSNLHSVKNIVNTILPDDRMPIMQDGTKLDIMISPVSITNRKNPSLIMECMLGMYLRELGKLHNIPVPKLLINQFNRDITFKKAADLLNSVGLPENCMFRLKNGTKGHVFKYSTLVGYIFLMRLHHHSEDKIKFSNEVNLDHRGYGQLGVGSQRLSRDEMEILWTYQAHNIIKEAKELNKKTSVNATIKEYVKCIGYEI